MTDKGWICLAVVMLFFVLMLAMIALWRISSNLISIAKQLGETNTKLQEIYYAQSRAASTIADEIDDVYRMMFSDAEVTIRRNGIEEDENDDI